MAKQFLLICDFCEKHAQTFGLIIPGKPKLSVDLCVDHARPLHTLAERARDRKDGRLRAPLVANPPPLDE